MAIDPTLPANYSAADTYTDLSGLAELRRGAAAKDPKAIRAVAQQFESMFTDMMLKSMRETVGTDPIFGSDQEQMFQGMYDQQLSLQLSKGKGLGLADMLIQQLQRMKAISPGAARAAAAPAGKPTAGAAGTAAVPAATASPATAATRSAFIRGLWPEAQAAGAQLGVDPRNLIAQAALETNWGRSLPAGSNNLFGVKATGAWTGASATAATTEYRDGQAVRTAAPFRAYGSTGQSFQDYVALLRGNPRFAAALNTGSDARAFAAGLQRGGYATDPDYVRKVGAVADQVSAHVAALGFGYDAGLKTAANLPITGTGGGQTGRT